MSKKLRIGILGASKIAPISILTPAKVRNDVEVTCVAAREPERARAFAAEHNIPAVAATYQDLIARDDVDLVHVSLPPVAHAEWSIRALEAGKAVLCEKPFAMNAAEAREMVATSARTGKPLIEAFHYRHHAMLLRLFALVARGELGAVRRLRANFDVPIPYRDGEFRWKRELGGGALMDLGCYAVHAVRTLAGSLPNVDAAFADIQHGVDAQSDARLSFPSGATASISTSMAAPHFSADLVVIGEKGSAEIRNFVAPQLGNSFRVTIDDSTREEQVKAPSTFAAQLQHLVDVTLHGATPLTGGLDAIANMQVIDTIKAKAGA